MVDVAVLDGDGVLVAGEVEGPVVVGVAGGRPGGLAFDEDIRDCHPGVLAVAGHDVLAANEGGLCV